MDLTGFSPIEIRDILHGGEPAVKPGEDTIPPIEPGPARTKRGDVWILGRHRLVCGDATDPEDYRRLFAGEVDRAALVVTDPPYGVAYQAQSGKFDRIHGDDAAGYDLLRLVKGALVRAMEYSTGEAAFYIFHASVTREDFAAAIRAAGLLERQYLIWAKPAPVLGHADYQWAHEPIFYSSRAGVSPKFYGDRKQTTMWRFGYATITGTTIVIGPGLLLRDGVGGTVYVLPRPPKGKGRVRTVRVEESSVVFIESGRPGATTVWEVGREIRAEHPTQKPVALIAHAINNSSRHGEIVLDPFMGSGTAIIAAEKTGRRGFGCEISPEYCDTTLRRWELWTGKQAKKEETNA
jgi:DNA modification methylase